MVAITIVMVMMVVMVMVMVMVMFVTVVIAIIMVTTTTAATGSYRVHLRRGELYRRGRDIRARYTNERQRRQAHQGCH
jgi:hypothetical protein